MKFVVLNDFLAYNTILGNPALSDFGAVITIWCLKMKLPTPHEVGVVEGSQSVSKECYVAELWAMNRLEKGKDSTD